MGIVNVELQFDVNDTVLMAMFNEMLSNEQFMLAVHNTLAKMCDPYVPMDEGALSQTLEISPEYVRYIQPYAHYMYTGVVYGPNIPIMEDGVIVGWFSPPGKPKHPTGKMINYSLERHPLATKEWDKAMLRDKRDEFYNEIKRLLKHFSEEG